MWHRLRVQRAPPTCGGDDGLQHVPRRVPRNVQAGHMGHLPIIAVQTLGSYLVATESGRESVDWRHPC